MAVGREGERRVLLRRTTYPNGDAWLLPGTGVAIISKKKAGRPEERPASRRMVFLRSEGETQPQLRQPLLALSRIAGERRGGAVRGGVAVADEAGRVLRVE